LIHAEVNTQSSVLLKADEKSAGQSVSPVELSELMLASGYRKNTIGGSVS
jgi:hypothetical protein